MSIQENPWIVLKLGGTSVGNYPQSIIQIIQHLSPNYRVAIVCSARSTDNKLKGTTSRLMEALELASKGDDSFSQLIKDIEMNHLEAAHDLMFTSRIFDTYQKLIQGEIKAIMEFLKALKVLGEVSFRSRDFVIGKGEKLSCLLISNYLKSSGIPSTLVSLENTLSLIPDLSPILDEKLYEQCSQHFAGEIQSHLTNNTDGLEVPVITGFFGLLKGGLIEQIGRGYSDFTAALVSVGLKAKELQIWKEVDGVFTADPRKVIEAKLLDQIYPDEAAELTYYGSEVIHPFTMDRVMKALIPIRIKNVRNVLGDGTIIRPNECINSGSELEMITKHNKVKLPTAVTIKDDVVILIVESDRKSVAYDFLANLFQILDENQLVVDLISTSEAQLSMAIPITSSTFDQRLKIVIDKLQIYGKVDVISAACIISLVGRQMKNMIGCAAKMFETLSDAGVNIEMISQGSSEINISCVISKNQCLNALNAIHKKMIENL